MNSINKTARSAGLLYLLLIPLGILGIIYVPSTLIVPGDVVATASNIMAEEKIFRFSIVSALSVQLVQILLVLLLYKILKSVNKNIAVLMVILVLVGVPIAMLNELNNLAVLMILNSADQPQSLISVFLDMHNSGIMIAQIFWGLWLFPLGYLIYRSTFLPSILGILLMIGCFGYLIDSFIFILFPGFGVTFSEYTFLGEVLLPLWLLVKGVNKEEWEKVN